MKNISVKDGSLFVVPDAAEKNENIINSILKLSKNANAENITIDLRGFNLFRCLNIGILSGTLGLIDNFENSYEIIVDNEVALKEMKRLTLSNIKVRAEKQQKSESNLRFLSLKSQLAN